jgi:phospholipid-binding lipoprotein MlaA
MFSAAVGSAIAQEIKSPVPPLPEQEVERNIQTEENDPDPNADSNNIIVRAQSADPLKDPLETINVEAFELTQEIDKALVEPLSRAYEEDMPTPVRMGLRNFLRTLMEPVNALNYLLQLDLGKAVETAGRLAINATLGVGGLVDVAKKEPFNLPYRRNGFANTLGYYGVGPGPFIVLPLVGATSLRDLLGSGIDQSIVPLALGHPFDTPYYAIPAYTINSFEFRIEFDEKISQVRESDDPYYALRESYLCQREADIAALKDLPPPRECEVDSIMQGPVMPPSIERSVVISDGLILELPPKQNDTPSLPDVIYVSQEVVQPLPN